MSGDQIPSLPGKKRRQMPGVCPGEMLKLRFDWYMILGRCLFAGCTSKVYNRSRSGQSHDRSFSKRPTVLTTFKACDEKDFSGFADGIRKIVVS